MALLRFETRAELETIDQYQWLKTDWMIDYNIKVTVYGFPKQDNGRSREIGGVISRLKLHKTLASLVGVLYNSDGGLRFVIDQSIPMGKSGGLTVSLKDGLIGVNQGMPSGQGLVTHFWETASLFNSLGLI